MSPDLAPAPMDERAHLATQATHLRALLDLSHQRERNLATCLVRLRDLAKGAAFAPDRAHLADDTLQAVDQTLEALQHTPAPEQGLYVRHAQLVAELAGARAANELLREELSAASDRTAHLADQLHTARLASADARAERDALIQAAGDDELARRLMEAGKQLLPGAGVER